MAGFEVRPELGHVDVLIHDGASADLTADAVLTVREPIGSLDTVARFANHEKAVDCGFCVHLPPVEPLKGARAPRLRLRSLLCQALAALMHERYGAPRQFPAPPF